MVVQITQRTVLQCVPYETGAVVDVPLPTGRLLVSIGKARPFVVDMPDKAVEYETAMMPSPANREVRS